MKAWRLKLEMRLFAQLKFGLHNCAQKLGTLRFTVDLSPVIPRFLDTSDQQSRELGDVHLRSSNLDDLDSIRDDRFHLHLPFSRPYRPSEALRRLPRTLLRLQHLDLNARQ